MSLAASSSLLPLLLLSSMKVTSSSSSSSPSVLLFKMVKDGVLLSELLSGAMSRALIISEDSRELKRKIILCGWFSKQKGVSYLS